MDLDAIRQWALAFIKAHKAWTPLIVGVLAFCEFVAVVSFLVSATVILLALGPMIAAADVAFWPVVLCAAIGAALGNWLSYGFGHYFKDDAKRMWPMRRYPAAVARAEAFCGRWGAGARTIFRADPCCHPPSGRCLRCVSAAVPSRERRLRPGLGVRPDRARRRVDDLVA